MPDRRRLRGAAVIAKRLGVSRSTVYAWWRDHGLPCFTAAGEASPLIVYADELDQWVERQRSAPMAAGERG